MKTYLFIFLKGIAIGAGAILPGISSGVLCVILGIYEKLLDSILYFFKDMKKNIKFLFPFSLGGLLGIVLFGNFLNFFLTSFPLQTKSIFIALILSSIPSLIKNTNKKCTFKPHYLFFLFATLTIGIITVLLEHFNFMYLQNSFSFTYLILSGFLMSIGVIFPGVSSTVILMLLGVYPTYLVAVSSINLNILLPLSLGLFLGCLICIKLIKFLLDNFYGETFYSIIGFTIGSIFILLPKITSFYELLIFISSNLLVFLTYSYIHK